MSRDIELLLASADDDRPALSGGLPLESAGREPDPSAGEGPVSFADFASDPDDLSIQRWGVIAPEGPLGDRLLAAVEPLIRLREEQQGAPARVYRAPSQMTREAAQKWKSRVYWDESVAEEDLPRYLLILGDLDEVSLELQQALSTDLFVGRLAGSAADLARYVEKVERWSRSPGRGDPRALFFTARDGTAATTIGYQALVAPSVTRCRERRDKGTFRASSIDEIGYESAVDAKKALLASVAVPEPAMLFSMSHGLGAPRGGWLSEDEQRAVQGTMSLGAGVRLTAEEVAKGAFLPGGVWFFLACYGGGTPSTSAYFHWLSQLRETGGFAGRVDSVLAGLPKGGDRPFLAALPKAAISNPDGPLAILAHVDLAWTYGFLDTSDGGRNKPSRFLGIFRSLVGGSRAGAAFFQLVRFLGEASVELTSMYDSEARAPNVPVSPERTRSKADLWMLRQDLGGYVLLGDPAVKLPMNRGPRANPLLEAR